MQQQQQPAGYGQPQPYSQPQQQYNYPTAPQVPQTTMAVPAGAPAAVVASGGEPQTIYVQDPEEYRVCGIWTSMIFLLVVFLGNIVALGSNMLVFESEVHPEFSGGISHFYANFKDGDRVILDLRVDEWDSVPALKAMKGLYEASTGMIIIGLLLMLPLIVIQICRLCRKIRHRKMWTWVTGILSILNTLFMLISYMCIYSSTQGHLDELYTWLEVHGSITKVSYGGSNAFVFTLLFSYICSVVLFAFGVRTCVGKRCMDCCCPVCTCNFAEDSTFKGGNRRSAAYQAEGGDGGNAAARHSGQADVYGDHQI